jgi:hypothetical protein
MAMPATDGLSFALPEIPAPPSTLGVRAASGGSPPRLAVEGPFGMGSERTSIPPADYSSRSVRGSGPETILVSRPSMVKA